MKFILGVIGYISKNMGLILGIVEQILKAAAGIVSMTPSRKDDKIVNAIEKGFGQVKPFLYKIGNPK